MFKRRMSRRAAVRAVSYTAAALAALSLFSAVSYGHLLVYRRQTKIDADRAFEETVRALEDLSESLEKSLYAADGGMCARVCADVYADAGRAGTAMSALPFSTVEMERLKRFVGVTGDYAYTLCREAAEQGFTDEQRDALSRLSGTASALADSLLGMRGELSDGALRMDSREAQVANVLDETPAFLSGELGGYAQSFPEPEALSYHGQYTARETPAREAVDEQQAREAAAALLGCRPEEPEAVGSCEDGGSLLLTLGSKTVVVTAEGVESLRDSRLVSESRIGEEEAEAAAEEALRALGYEGLRIEESGRRGDVMDFRCSAEADGVAGLDRMIGVSVAMDDGSVYALDLGAAAGEAAESGWPFGEEEARSRVPEGLELRQLRRVTLAGADGCGIACWELLCTDGQDRQVRLYLNADTGKQEEIRIGG